MKIGDKFQLIGSKRAATVTGIGGTSVYYLFDDNALEDSLPIMDFHMWFEPMVELPFGIVRECDCGGYTTYKSFDDHYHSYWCKSQGGKK